MAIIFEYESQFCLSPVSELTILIETYWWEPKIPNPTPLELGSLPERFRCYVCGEVRGRKHFGGHILKQWVCRTCFPWVDESWVGALIHWDENHGYARFVRD